VPGASPLRNAAEVDREGVTVSAPIRANYELFLSRTLKLPGSRMLDGRFMGVQQFIGVPRGRDAGLSYLKSVVEDAKASGLVARAIEKTGARGVSVAPRAPAP
jgi:polar amino acid transport system substrate-binding protein